jgi:hypothetical protein
MFPGLVDQQIPALVIRDENDGGTANRIARLEAELDAADWRATNNNHSIDGIFQVGYFFAHDVGG